MSPSIYIRNLSRRAQKSALAALLCSVGLALFAYLSVYPFPIKAIALIPLLMTAYIMSRSISSPLASLRRLFRNIYTLKTLLYTVIGLQMGIAAAMYYRGDNGMTTLPEVFKSFAFLAASIGMLEELVFRSFIQGRLVILNTNFALLYTAFANATYKTCLFLSPVGESHIDLISFFFWSFGAYVGIGLLRYYSKSMIPVLILHAVFDLLVYAENSNAPWWVW